MMSWPPPRDELVSYVKGLLRRYGVRPSRRLGQTFTVDPDLLRDMAGYAELSREDVVLEVGAGLGCLTRLLAERAGRVIAVEVDRRLVNALRDELSAYSNVEVVEGDFLEMDGFKVDKVVSTVPYSIASPLTFKLLRDVEFKLAVLAYQREFAERLVARPGSRDYGRLTVAVSLYAEARIARYVHRSSFYPAPDVDSAIVLMRPRPTRPPIGDYDRFDSLLRLLFSQRNKLLMGVLRRAAERGLIPRVEEASLGGLANRRVRDLSLDDLCAVYRAVYGG